MDIAYSELVEARRRWWYGRVERTVLKLLIIIVVLTLASNVLGPIFSRLAASIKAPQALEEARTGLEVAKIKATRDSILSMSRAATIMRIRATQDGTFNQRK